MHQRGWVVVAERSSTRREDLTKALLCSVLLNVRAIFLRFNFNICFKKCWKKRLLVCEMLVHLIFQPCQLLKHTVSYVIEMSLFIFFLVLLWLLPSWLSTLWTFKWQCIWCFPCNIDEISSRWLVITKKILIMIAIAYLSSKERIMSNKRAMLL